MLRYISTHPLWMILQRMSVNSRGDLRLVQEPGVKTTFNDGKGVFHFVQAGIKASPIIIMASKGMLYPI